jgi:hypothetical protein
MPFREPTTQEILETIQSHAQQVSREIQALTESHNTRRDALTECLETLKRLDKRYFLETLPDEDNHIFPDDLEELDFKLLINKVITALEEPHTQSTSTIFSLR